MKKIQLNIAWMWDCDKCGRENFERSFMPEVDPDEMERVTEEIEGAGETLLCAFPFEVICEYCGEEYETEMG